MQAELMKNSKTWGWDPAQVIPNPGSSLALDQGCMCAVLDNAHGEGLTWSGKRVWWMDMQCTLHTKRDHDE